MSIHFISGKPGGGKSYSALREYVLPELVKGNRIIVTNLDLDLPSLAQYLHDEFGETYNMRERVVVLSHDEVAQFWLRYQDGLLTDRLQVTMPSGKRISHVDYAPRVGKGGILYIIDEVHEFFNARHWQNTGDDALHYLSQHRKLGDDVVCVTQSIGNVDKQFRSLAQDFTYLRNHGKESLPVFGGFFRSVGGFSKSVYLEPWTGTGTQTAVESRYYRLDSRIAGCYRTAGGVGIKGAAADTQEKKRGLPSVGVLVAFVGLCLLGWFGLKKGAFWLMGMPMQAVAAQGEVVKSVSPVGPVNVNVAAPVVHASEKEKPPSVLPGGGGEKRRLTGLSTVGGVAYAMWSDGDVRCHTDRGWGGLVRRAGRPVGVVFDGREWIVSSGE